ncbi:MAG: hypothetical protein HY530_04585 [Chloroflexi bacterium]|nr:hypothetical protein [Chloroflexota bacterium]
MEHNWLKLSYGGGASNLGLRQSSSSGTRTGSGAYSHSDGASTNGNRPSADSHGDSAGTNTNADSNCGDEASNVGLRYLFRTLWCHR